MSSLDNDKPTYWGSIAELEGDPEFREFVEREFATPLDEHAPSSDGRRRFLQLMGASLALAGCRWEKDYELPHARRPEDAIPGKPKFFTTAMEIGGVGYGLKVRSYDGRPIKIEGNPAHPASLGASSAIVQATLLEMYDPDRSRGVARYDGGARAASSWADFEAAGRALFDAAKATAGQTLAVLSEATSSPAVLEMKKRLKESYPQVRWYEYEAASRDNERKGSQLAFGQPRRLHLSLDKAEVVLALDADVFVRHPNALRNARDFVERRAPEAGTMSRLYAVESVMTSTGGMADHRLPLRASHVKAFAMALDAALSPQLPESAGAQPRPQAAFLADAKVSKFLDAVVRDLLASRGKSAIVAGEHQAPEVHALAHRLNVLLGNVGQAVLYSPEPDQNRPTHFEAMQQLVGELNAGRVETLLVLGGNPVFDAPADLDFPTAYAKAKNRIRLGLYEDETSVASTWHLPRAHYLEAWGDVRTWDGTLSITQPLIAPLFGGRTALEVLAFVVNEEQQKGLELLRRTHRGWAADDRVWRRALHDGFVPGTRWGAAPTKLETIPPLQLSPAELGGLEVQNGALEVVLLPDSRLHDGRFANNAWLQELPEFVTKLTWDTAALVSPATAKALGIVDTTLIKIAAGGRELSVPALVTPGIAAGSLVLAYGNGRAEAGHVGGSEAKGVPSAGTNVYPLRTTAAPDVVTGVSVTASGKKVPLATTQDKHSIDQLGLKETQRRIPTLIREQTLAEYAAKPDAARHVVHHPPLLSLWREPVSYEGRKWGMTVDLNKCVGCSACVTACQAENNVPVVGKEQVLRGREMHWIRVDRYFKGDPDDPQLVHQVVTCHHCEHAPCEQVCPVGATIHSEEGLNDMVYNRCIGTRYCSNNCPYKVRRFNYLNYTGDTGPLGRVHPLRDPDMQVKAMVYNPEVSVRFRGVMEKCTFCVQRIKAVTIPANNERRPVRDQEIKTACQETCPTNAIEFGDLNDGGAKVRELQYRPRAYAMLGELNVRPRLLYLARVRNPSAELAPAAPESTEGH